MDTQAIERVQTQEVRDVLWAYREFYYLDRPELGPVEERRYRVCGCGSETGQWPHNETEDGTPVVCEAHEWQAKQTGLQSTIVSAGLSMPIPKRLGEKDLKGQAALKEKMGSLVYYHPLFSFPQIVGLSKGTISAGQTAAWVAAWLSGVQEGDGKYRMEHVVFYVHHSQALNLLYERRNREIEDVLLWSPVLVYFHNRDGRENGWTRQLIESRQYGLAFIMEE